MELSRTKALIHAKLALKKADLSFFQLHAVGAYLSDGKLPGLEWSTPGHINVTNHGIEQFFYRYLAKFSFSMMIQGDDGYGEMAIAITMAIVMMMKKRLQWWAAWAIRSVCHWFTGLHRW